MEKIKVAQYGLGPVGLAIADAVLKRPWLELVGAIDIDKNKVGKDIGELLGTREPIGITVTNKPKNVFKNVPPKIVTHATSSRMQTIHPQLLEIIENGASVVSTAEELSYPFVKYPELAKELDERARSHGVCVLGTGINPGFVLDTLAVVLSGTCQKVNSIRAERVIDVSTRRPSLQRKVGVGLSPTEFDMKVQEGTVKHVGLPESVGLIALAMGWKVGEIQERITPVIAESPIRVGQIEVPSGSVAGIRQVAKGILAGQELVVLDLRIYVGAPNPHDSILVDAVPPVDCTIKGGIHGDLATIAIIVNSLPKIGKLEPGLRTMIDLAPIPPSPVLHEADRSVMLKTF